MTQSFSWKQNTNGNFLQRSKLSTRTSYDAKTNCSKWDLSTEHIV